MKTRTDHLSDREGLVARGEHGPGPGATLSYQSLEAVGSLESRRTEVDQSDGDDLFFEICAEVYGGKYARVYCLREIIMRGEG